MKKNICLTCGVEMPLDRGNNPDPIVTYDDPDLGGRQVCNDCNSLYVIPARMGQHVEGDLFSKSGHRVGTFRSMTAFEIKPVKA